MYGAFKNKAKSGAWKEVGKKIRVGGRGDLPSPTMHQKMTWGAGCLKEMSE